MKGISVFLSKTIFLSTYQILSEIESLFFMIPGIGLLQTLITSTRGRNKEYLL